MGKPSKGGQKKCTQLEYIKIQVFAKYHKKPYQLKEENGIFYTNYILLKFAYNLLKLLF